MTASEQSQIEDAPNSAYALRDLFERVRTSGKDNFQNGWASALGAGFPSREFSERHSAMMDLFGEVSATVRAFPDESREYRRYSPYLQKWHGYAIGYPNWNGGIKLAEHLDVPVLDQLESLGQFLESSNSYPSGQATSSELTELLRALEALKDVVDASEVPPAIRDRIAYHLRQAEWYMAHASTFGAAAIKRHATSAASEGLGLFSRVTSPELKKKISNAALWIFAALGHVEDVTGDVHGIIENVTGTYSAIEQVVATDGNDESQSDD